MTSHVGFVAFSSHLCALSRSPSAADLRQTRLIHSACLTTASARHCSANWKNDGGNYHELSTLSIDTVAITNLFWETYY